ncbi:GSCOCT00004194001.3-RA-CDS [Cotesia congregata]|uniref:Odorant receptor n=1 Tax=Cotesia congregata TaxID=51543 RepID=A0A8J2HUC3_COTCN|nr:GSCOCT00004194001.3-RA-CDS [Cotesia congregata]CAG5109166.1 olfactory receptor 110 [Cotesia congregata]
MIVEKRIEYMKFQIMVKRFLCIIGFWSSENSNIFFKNLLFLHLSFFIIPIIGVINFFKTHISNIHLATKGLSVLVGFSTVIVKVACFVINRKDINDLYKILDPYVDELLNKSGISDVVLKGISNFRRLCKIAAGFVTVSCSSYAITPILSIISQWRHQKRPIRYNLIYPTAYPWEHPASGFLYNCHFLNEYLTTFSIVTVTASIDSVFVYYVFQIIGMIREISHDMSRFDQGNVDAIIRQCVQQYEVLLECRRKVEKIFGPIILWSMGTNAIILCAVIFQLSHAKTIPFTVIVICAAYAGLKLTQIFIFAWAGSQLTIESENLIDTIYAANWLGNKRTMTSILMMLTQKPLVLTACSLSTVSIDMFVSVINTTISYYLLLKTFEADT